MNVTIQISDSANTIELRFDEIVGTNIAYQLKLLGFKSTRGQFWIATKNLQRKRFANDLKIALDKQKQKQEDISIDILPSFEAINDNITALNFSYVTIYYTKDNKKENERYIVFERLKKVAQHIANQFGKKTYGDQFLEAHVIPKKYVREARKLLELKKVIGNKTQGSITENVTKHPVQKILLSLDGIGGNGDFDKAKEFHTWEAANKEAKHLVDKISNVYYQINWADGEVREGVMDLEPSSFYKGKTAILSTWKKLF